MALQQRYFSQLGLKRPMIVLIIASLIGVLIGLHYRVLAVVPVSLLVVLVSSVGATISGYTFFGIVFAALTSAIGLQVGYVVGVASRGLLGQFLSRSGAPQSKRI